MSAFFPLKHIYLHMWCFLLIVQIFYDSPVTLFGLSSSLYLVSSVSSSLALFFHLFLPTHTSNIWKTVFYFLASLLPFSPFPSEVFQSLVYTPLPLVHFLLTILPVCNLIIPTTSPLNTCSCKSQQLPLDCQSQGLFSYPT